jgi:hypothetical protein
MLQLTDTHLARLAIAATAIAPHVRGRWLAEIAARPDPPPMREAAMAAFAKSWRGNGGVISRAGRAAGSIQVCPW